MNSLLFYTNILRGLTRMLMNYNYKYILFYTFLHYVLVKLKVLVTNTFNWTILPDNVFKNLVKQFYNEEDYYVDCSSCLLANVQCFKVSIPTWFYVCSPVSLRKYKLLVIPLNDTDTNEVFVSEILRHNIENALQCTVDTCFLLPIKHNDVNFAIEAKISMVSNPYENANDVVIGLLENYFYKPRFLRKNDLFGINVKENISDQVYLHSNSLMSVIYFKVNAIKGINKNCTISDSCYILHGETTLIQESNVHSYLPRKHSYCDTNGKMLTEPCPPSFAEPLKHLEYCILPFIKCDIQLPIKPIFLVKGLKGSNKCDLIQTVSEKIGLNFLCTDFAEVQALTSVQTEAKLRIVLHNAKQSAPCILCLNNIEIFGKNSDGQKDERIISTFSTEISTLYDKRLKYPIIIVATTNESDISPELNRMFIETIHVEHLDHDKRTALISWLLAKRNLHQDVNLSKISGMCSDFRFSDLKALIHHAIKFQCKRCDKDFNSLTLLQEDFDKAYEYMQSIYTDCKGVPRVPKVYWEDIGGLADLKHEIMRRIQLPLLNSLGFGQSGLLLYGPPGTGKTLLAKAVATEYQLHFLSIKGPEILNMYVGQSEKNVRQGKVLRHMDDGVYINALMAARITRRPLPVTTDIVDQMFERARASAPCIIFFDELDSLAPNRGRSGDSGGVMDRVVSQLLAEMDGLDCSSNIFIIGATNRPDLIDRALLRPGRFDKLLYVGIHSDRDSQLRVLEALTRKFQLHENGEELSKLIQELPDHTTGADLYSVCSNAWLNAARRVLSKHDQTTISDQLKSNNSITVGLEDFSKAARELIPSVSEEEAERYRKMQTELSSIS